MTQPITCTRRIQFCAGHRVMGHENKCAHLHGHNYVAFFTAEAVPESAYRTDDVGRVIDFSVLKERLGGWIDRFWDHGFLLHEMDHATIKAISALNAAREEGGEEPQKVYVMPSNPTAENMAWWLLINVAPRLLADTGIRIRKVRIWETENCYADAELEEFAL